ncbi:MAG: three-Cys-motif partner protein TcmP [Firmicutes bacterium]|nr:three-Cys-motif partner protein TcmP [Bacillota bacterium]
MHDIHPAAPTLVVLDPTGVIGQVQWATIETIAKWRTEIFLNFPYHMAVQRLLPNQHEKLTDEMAKKLDDHLPPGWRSVYDQCVGTDRRFLARGFLELYRKGLQELGYTYVFGSSVFKTDAGLPLYYLIWAGRHQVGANIAKHVLFKQFDPQIRLLAPEDDWLA